MLHFRQTPGFAALIAVGLYPDREPFRQALASVSVAA